MNEEIKEFADILFAPTERDNYKQALLDIKEYVENYKDQFDGVHPYIDMRYFDLNRLLDTVNNAIGDDK